MSRTARTLLLALAALAPIGLAGCDDSASVTALDGQVTELRAETKKLQAERDRLAARLEQTERRLAGLQEDLMSVRKAAQAPAAAAPEAAPGGLVDGAPVAEGPKTDPRSLQAAKDFADMLSTEEGRKAFDAATRAYEQRREDERGQRMATGMVDAFAARANLSPDQKARMEKVVQKSMAEIGQIWRSMRDPELTPETRQLRQQENVAKMEEIRQRTDDEMKSVLDATQWDMYQQESARMRGFMQGGMGGGMGGPGGRGGMGGGRGGDRGQ